MFKRRRFLAMLLGGAFVLAPALAAQGTGTAAAAGSKAEAGPRPGTRWTDPDGKPLPFASEQELIDFLATAEVKSEQALSGGVTFPRKILLEKDGVRANAVFRDINEDSTNSPSFGGGRDALFFRDSYIYEPAAYKLSRMLGLDNVPPATLRKVKGKNGSVQIWVENSMTQKSMNKQGLKPPDATRWNKQLQMMNTFDALIYNTDRNSGNLLITPDWKLWMIDHTRAFRRNPGLQRPDAIKQCERGVYLKLKGLDEKAAAAALKEDLSPYELDALFKRRALLVEHLDKLIAEHGESEVLYVDTEDTSADSAR
jgi:hypothetical protein